MRHPWHDLPTGTAPPDIVTAVVEIPRGSRNKYELDKDTGLFRLDRVLYSAVAYPGEYGFIPRTLAEDGDPCDVLVLTGEPTFSGCCIDVRPIGLLRMLDRDEPDAKILAVPAGDPFHSESFGLTDLPAHTLKEIAHFFEIYKDLEGKRVHIIGWEPGEAPSREILDSVRRYQERFGPESAQLA